MNKSMTKYMPQFDFTILKIQSTNFISFCLTFTYYIKYALLFLWYYLKQCYYIPLWLVTILFEVPISPEIINHTMNNILFFIKSYIVINISFSTITTFSI